MNIVNHAVNEMTRVLIMTSVIVAGLSACAQSGSSTPRYSQQELGKLTYCVGIADTAMYAASQKLNNISIEQLKKHYADKQNAELNIATVDKVYRDKFSSAWDYAVGFYEECALNVAEVAAARVQMASYCHQNSLIASVAHAYKTAGSPKEKAYQHFAVFKSTTPNAIVDRVYAAAQQTRAQAKLESWNQCMGPLTAK